MLFGNLRFCIVSLEPLGIMNMAAKKQTKPLAADIGKSQDPLLTLQKNIKPISTVVIAILIVVIVVIAYTNYTNTRENDAWNRFEEFKRDMMQSLTIDESKVQNFLTEIEGTSAEPWALAFCTSLYFDKRNFVKASMMLDRLEERYKNHYLCKYSNFYKEARSKISNDLQWLEKNSSPEIEQDTEENNS